MNKNFTQKKVFIGALFFLASASAYAQEIKKEKEIDEVVLTVGSRNKSRVAMDVPSPIDVFNVSDISLVAPQNNLNQILNFVAPSFTSNPAATADGTDHIDPAQLRGLGPDQVLVLMNGKRRHTSSLVNINGSPGRGSVGTDLNAIPASSIERIEVLRDGASALYGSDAIAGVINVVLKKNKGLSGSLQYGTNLSSASNNFSGGVDGQTYQLDLNYGIPIGKKGGFFNITGSTVFRENTSRSGIRNGNIFNAFNAVERIAANNGIALTSLLNDTTQLLNTIKQYAPEVSYFTNAQQSTIQNANSLSAMRSALTFDVTNPELNARGLTRKDTNMKVGQSQLASGQMYYNASIPLGEQTSLYSFGGFSYRNGKSYAFYRLPNGGSTTTGIYANGFLPEIQSTIFDFSTALGLNTKLAGFDVDLSSNLGTNSFRYDVNNTANASLGLKSPDSFYAGRLNFLQNTNNIDFSKKIDFLEGLNLAFGGEFRYENFRIDKGEEASYSLYDINGNMITDYKNTNNQYILDFFGNKRGAGAQGFSGFSNRDEKNKNRKSAAGYLNIELNFTNRWMIDAAIRYENYSDFGNTFNYKLATLYKITPNFNWRASGQTGFRAPSLQQKYFSSTSTQFINGLPYQVAYFTNDSEAADIIGIASLKPETSKSLSTGFTLKIPSIQLSITADAYITKINDRIILTGQYSRPDDAQITKAIGIQKEALSSLQSAFDKAGAERASFWTNGINSETKGIDVVITHKIKIADGVSLRNDLAGSFTQTKRVGSLNVTQKLVDAGGAVNVYNFFPESSRVYLEEAIPRFKANLSNTLSFGKVEIFMRNAYFGKVTDPGSTDVNLDGYSSVYEHPVYSGKVITDLSFSYQFTKGLRFTVGANNVGDVYPDINPTLLNNSFVNNTPTLGNPSTDLSSQNQFAYSRAVSQFGLNGRYLFARINFKF